MSLTTGFGNHFCQAIINALLGAQSWTPPATWYVAALTTDPTDDDGTSLVEVTTGQYGGYARVSVTNNTTNFPSSSVVSHVTTLTSGSAIDFGTNSGGSGCTILGIAFYDASSSGNLGPWGPLSTSKTVNNGDSFKIPTGNLTATQS